MIQVEDVLKLQKDLSIAINEIKSAVPIPPAFRENLNDILDEYSYLKSESDSALRLVAEQAKTIELLSAENQELTSVKETLTVKEEEIRQLTDKCEEFELKCKQTLDEMASVEEALMDDLARLNSEVLSVLYSSIKCCRTRFLASSLN